MGGSQGNWGLKDIGSGLQGTHAFTALTQRVHMWLSGVATTDGSIYPSTGPYLEEGCGCLKAHMGNRYPLAAGQMGVARADAGEGRERQDPWGQRRVGSMRPVHLIWVAEGPTPSQWIHNLQGQRVSKAAQALGEPLTAPHSAESTLGILHGFGDSVPWKDGTSWLGSSSSLWHEALRRP